MFSGRTLMAVSIFTLLAGCQVDGDAGSSAVPVGAEAPSSSGTLGTGWAVIRGEPAQITFKVHGDRAIFEGDIDLGPVDVIPTSREALERTLTDGVRGMGSITYGSGSRWNAGNVPYVIDPALPMQYRVTDAIAHIEANNPGVNFLPRTASHADYLYITRNATECNSHVGRIGGRQVINLADGCGTGSTIHELLHALGMWHEQSRCDRNSFVEVLWANVQPGYEHAFNQYCASSTPISGDIYDYDEGSIMHYHPYAYSRNGAPTLRSLRGRDYLMGQISGMSATDVKTIRFMYTDPAVCGDGRCYPEENNLTCPADCQPFCGDLICQSGEEGVCTDDCPPCGDGICTIFEQNGSCVADCGSCGNGVCEGSDAQVPLCSDCWGPF